MARYQISLLEKKRKAVADVMRAAAGLTGGSVEGQCLIAGVGQDLEKLALNIFKEVGVHVSIQAEC